MFAAVRADLASLFEISAFFGGRNSVTLGFVHYIININIELAMHTFVQNHIIFEDNSTKMNGIHYGCKTGNV